MLSILFLSLKAEPKKDPTFISQFHFLQETLVRVDCRGWGEGQSEGQRRGEISKEG